MPSEIREKPPSTPHPDQPRTPGAAGEGVHRRRDEPEKTQEFDPDDMVFDSVVDDLNLKLAESVLEPDPALKSIDPFGAKKQPSGGEPPIPQFLAEKRNQPGTAEIFGDVGSRSDEIAPHREGRINRLFSRLFSGAARRRSSGSRGVGEAIPAPHRTGEFLRVDSGSHDDENGADIRTTLLTLLLLSYSSAVTLGLAWVLWAGRSIHPADRPASQTSHDADPQAAKSPDPDVPAALPPIPPENVTSVGQTIRVGDVEVTPLAAGLAPVELVGAIDPADYRVEAVHSLVLRFKLTNRSQDHAFKPLSRNLLRNVGVPAVDRSFVETPDGGKINLYPLAVESEWLILGQPFTVLKPGESVETLVASRPVTEDRLPDQMTWRIRLRIGPYRTDMLGVRFAKSDLSH
jgi:hypothetical protein